MKEPEGAQTPIQPPADTTNPTPHPHKKGVGVSNQHSTPRALSTKHSHMLEHESGLDPGIIQERGYRTVQGRAELEGFPDWQRRLGLYIPMFSPDGITQSCQLRPNRPITRKNGSAPKYETPQGSDVIIDVHPRMMEEVRAGDGDLFVVEGLKKSDSLASRGAAAVALAGVWMAHIPKSKPKQLLPCWRHVRLDGRRVYIGFDSDLLDKEGVQDAAGWLVGALEERGADVLVCYLPPGEDGKKIGVDDYLAAGGTVAELKMLARKFEPEELGKVRLSRDEKLRVLVEDLSRMFWSFEWKGMGGHSTRDVFKVMADAAARWGKPHPDGVRIQIAWSTLSLQAGSSTRTVAKAIGRLEEWGLAYRDTAGREAHKSGAFVLRASVKQVGGSQATGGSLSRTSEPSYPGTLQLRSPRLRWSSPGSKSRRGVVRGTRRVRETPPRKGRPAVKRLGKIRSAVLDALEYAGGSATLQELADTLQRSRPRDLRRRTLPMLEEAGIITVEEDLIALSDNWLEALDEARRAGGEIERRELDSRRYRDRSKAFRERNQVKATPHWTNDPEADGTTEDLRPAHQGSEGSEVASEQRESAPDPDAAVVLGYVERLGKIRLGLLEQIWLEDHGGDLSKLRRAIEVAGVQRERLREFRNAEFLLPPQPSARVA